MHNFTMLSVFFFFLYSFSLISFAQSWVFVADVEVGDEDGAHTVYMDEENIEFLNDALLVDLMHELEAAKLVDGNLINQFVSKHIINTKMDTFTVYRITYYLNGKFKFRINLEEDELTPFTVSDIPYMETVLFMVDEIIIRKNQ